MGSPFVGTLLFLMAKVAQFPRSPESVSSSPVSTTILWAQPTCDCAVARGRRSSPDGTCGEPMTNLPFHLTLPKHIAWLSRAPPDALMLSPVSYAASSEAR